MNYNEVYESSLEYFDGDELAAKVFVDKYALRDNDGNFMEKTPEDMHRRLAKEFAKIEKNKFKKPLSEDEVFSYLDKFKYIVTQGSPMFGIGNIYQYVSISSCFVLTSPEDSYGSILATDEEIVQVSKRRGGVGIDLSKLRPSGSPTNNSSRTSTGVTSFMERYSNSINEVGQSGRRGAEMQTISCHHPDILKFVNIKRDLKKVTGANISVKLSNEFLTAVKNDTDYELRFPVDAREKGEEPKISQMVKAKDIWDDIVENARENAEPGILFWDNIIENSPADSYKDFGFNSVSTNPCGEIPLCELDSCRLTVLNSYSYVDEPFTKNATFNFIKFFDHVVIAQRLMDDIVDLEVESIDRIIDKVKSDPESDYIKQRELTLWEGMKIKAIQGRRTGLGLTAVGDTLAALNIGYATDDSIDFIDDLYRTLKFGAYFSSVEMAKELGAFPIFDYELEKDNNFLLRIKDEFPFLYEEMKKYGRRNIACLTTAPGGSVSIETQTTSGIEPVFMMSYTRRKKINEGDVSKHTVDFVDELGIKWQEFKVYHPKIKEWMRITGETDETKSPWSGYCAEDLNWKNRVRLQATAQSHICHSISSTINLPEEVTVEQVKEIYETAWESGCKGMTIYRKNSRSGVLVESPTKKEEKSEFKNSAPKRPKTLQADVHHFRIKGVDYYVTIGLNDGSLYEIFVGENHEDENVTNEIKYRVPKKVKNGIVEKVKRGCYNLITEDDIYRLTGNIDNDDIDALTRMISTSLRHGIDVSFIVQQLEKIKGFDNFPKALAKALKKYIKDGTKVSGETCPSCNSINLIRQDGCIICAECGWTKC